MRWRAEKARLRPRPEHAAFRGALDFASDVGVLAFAAWTLIAYVGMATKARTGLLFAAWLVTLPLVTGLAVFLYGRRRAPEEQRPEAEQTIPPSHLHASQRRLVAISVVAGLVAAFVAAPGRFDPWPFVWLLIAVAVAIVVVRGPLRRTCGEGSGEPLGWGADLFAALVGLTFSVMSLLIVRANPDDVFYVNRAVATDQLDHIPVLDVIFTHEEVRRGGGAGLPVETFAPLEGASAHAVGIHPASFAYYVVPPLMTFFATWALWRLLREWAPRRAVLCLALASVFLVFSAQYPLTSGSYFLTRIWQGKIAFVAWLIPIVYVYLTRWVRRADLAGAVLLLAAGVAAIGMTSTATFVGPLLALTALIPLVFSRRWRACWVPLAFGAIPLSIGLFALSRFPLSAGIGIREPESTWWFYHEVFGTGVVALVGGAALWTAPWLARAGAPARLAAGIGVVVALLLAPGIIPLLHDVSGLTETLRRLFWVASFPALVGLLAAVPSPARLPRSAVAGFALPLMALLAVFGHPLWVIPHPGVTKLSSRGAIHWRFPPAWKVARPGQLTRARAIMRAYDGPGSVLADSHVMNFMARIAVEPKAVDARDLYAWRTDEPRRRTRERIFLRSAVKEATPRWTLRRFRHAVDDLGVGLICIRRWKKDLLARVERAVPEFREAFTVSGQVCLKRARSP